MPLYSCAVVGTGADGDPIRPPISGDPRIGWICLAPPGSTTGRGLLFLPTASLDARIRLIADDPTERTTTTIRNVWQNELGITLASASTASWAELVAEIMRDHGRTNGTRWGVLQPSKMRQRFEIFLGALGAIWTAPAPVQPATQTFTETWPTNSSTLSSGQDQSWTEIQNDMEVSAGKLRSAATNNSIITCQSLLDTTAQYHAADYTMVDGVALNNQFDLRVRAANDNANWYRINALRASVSGHSEEAAKRVANANTQFFINSLDPGASGRAEIRVDGSTVSAFTGAFSNSATDGTPELLTNFKGGCLCGAVSAVGDVTLDNHTIADVVSAAGSKRPMGRMFTYGVR